MAIARPPDSGATPTDADGAGDGTAVTVLSPSTGPADADATATADGPVRQPAPLPLGSRLGRYVLLELLGKGGMAMVYRAYDPELRRDVAVKVLRVDRHHRDRAHARLLREAQALARLSHPNVIAVHDVGTYGDDVFIAMELVAGKTLRDWLTSENRTPPQIVAVMLAAGRGLAAAHAVGLVHRDFKPGNVMIGDDGRVRVLDFGLARRGAGEPTSSPSATPSPPPPTATIAPDRTDERAAVMTGEVRAVAVAREPDEVEGDSLLDQPLTRADMVVGTPAYMAPEQFGRSAADERCDQFSFGVTLYEALYGERPFASPRSRGSLSWVLRPTPAGARVPGWLRAVVLRAIALEPSRRYPSMQLLLDALERDLGARRRRIAAGAGAAVALGSFALLAMRGGGADAVCQLTGDELVSAWDGPRRGQVRGAFLASGHPLAADRFARFSGALDDYTGRWRQMRVSACRATRITGAQSEALLDLRMACLDRLRDRLGALTAVYAGALDGAAVDGAPDTAFRLGDLGRCADADALLGTAPPPRDPARRALVDGVREHLDEAEALHQAGRSKDALGKVRQAVAEAGAVGDPGLRAEAAFLLGDVAGDLADAAASTAALYDAARLGAEAHDDELVARTWIDLVYQIGYREARFDDGEAMLRVAEAAVARAGGDDALRLALLHRRAVLAYMQGRVPAARADFEQAVALAEAVHGPDHPRVADMLVSLGNVLKAQGELARARASHERATAIYERALGPEHPRVTFGLENLGTVLEGMGDFAGAAALYQRSAAICEKSYGPTHPDVAHALGNVGSAMIALGKPADAEAPLRRALAINEATLGAQHPDTAQILFQLGRAAAARGDRTAAEALHRRALTIRLAALGEQHAEVAASRKALEQLGAR